ncbi:MULTISPECIES: hypothetical protein [Bradyrhizobium]|uniref:hypothetical protein n=1 Tax=Bradyrhizobium elkanii TaxID=29448 RepID=UPI001FD9A381|nr:hypothetical protein [Bradyrhizobium elkanii]
MIACQILQAPFDLLDHARPVWLGHNAPFVWPGSPEHSRLFRRVELTESRSGQEAATQRDRNTLGNRPRAELAARVLEVKDDGTRRNGDQDCDIGDRLSLRRPCKLLALALGQFTSSVLLCDKRNVEPRGHVGM